MEEFEGTAQVKTVRLQSLRREFETLFMQNGETVQGYLSRANAVVNQMKSFEEILSNETIVAKILRSLLQKFDHVVAAIEDSKDLSKLFFDALMGSLRAHEDIINRFAEKGEERAFQATAGTSMQENKNARGREREVEPATEEEEEGENGKEKPGGVTPVVRLVIWPETVRARDTS